MVDKEMTSPSDKAMSDRLSKNYGHARIGVVGVGGGGTNAIARLMSQGPHDLEFICVNTDTQSNRDNPTTTTQDPRMRRVR